MTPNAYKTESLSCCDDVTFLYPSLLSRTHRDVMVLMGGTVLMAQMVLTELLDSLEIE